MSGKIPTARIVRKRIQETVRVYLEKGWRIIKYGRTFSSEQTVRADMHAAFEKALCIPLTWQLPTGTAFNHH